MKTLIIGAGPAGAACALWLHQLGCPVLLIEKNTQAGGLQALSPYENRWVPSVLGRKGQEIAQAMHEQLLRAGVPLRMAAAAQRVSRAPGKFEVLLEDGTVEEGTQLVLATGARFRTGGFKPTDKVAIGPGEPVEAIDLKGKRVALLGGGDNAFDQYVFAVNRGAHDCRIFARSVKAQKKLQDMVPAEHVVVGPFMADQDTMTVNGEPFDVFVVLFGFEAAVPAGLEELKRTSAGFVEADPWGRTSMEGVYAAGEVAQTFHPCVVTSFAHGIQVAKDIQRRLGL